MTVDDERALELNLGATQIKDSDNSLEPPKTPPPIDKTPDPRITEIPKTHTSRFSPKQTVKVPEARRGMRILAVDDNEINLQLLQRFLAKRKDDAIDSARDGFEAVAAFRDAQEPYDIIFMDISMPGMDGFEATRKIRQCEAERRLSKPAGGKEAPFSTSGIERVYVIALTGLGAGRDREEASKSGFDDYLTKPIPFKKVGKILQEHSEKLAP